MLFSRPLRSIVIASLVLLGGSAGVDAAVGVRPRPVRNESAIVANWRSEASDEQLFVDKINELRTGLGLEPLAVHPTLVPLARDWAAHLRTQGALSHAPDLSVGVTENWSRLGENVGVGPANQVQALFDAFVASPAHDANLVKADYRYIGVGVVYDTDGRIWTAHRFVALASDGSGTATTSTPPPTTAPPTTLPSMAPPTTRPTTSPTTAPTRPTTPTTAAAGSEAPASPDPALPAAQTDPTATDSTEPAAVPPRPIVAPELVRQLSADLEAAGL
ncbi:MAG: CAP domain-containing protein [Acidimicrobiales bacterium]